MGEPMKEHDETLFKTAVQALQTAEPDPAQISVSAKRVAGHLGIAMESELLTHPANNTIESCEDVRQLLGSYRTGTLSPARTLLVEAHLHDCRACLRQSQSWHGSRATVLDWSPPKASRAITWRPRSFA